MAQVLPICIIYRYEEVVFSAQPQQGEASYYWVVVQLILSLDPESSLSDWFNLCVADNMSYPAFFI